MISFLTIIIDIFRLYKSIYLIKNSLIVGRIVFQLKKIIEIIQKNISIILIFKFGSKNGLIINCQTINSMLQQPVSCGINLKNSVFIKVSFFILNYFI